MDSINVRVAKRLLEIKAVFLRPQEPFTWASGIKSPIYCDNRLILTAPEARNEVEQAIADTVKWEYPEAEVLMGTATAGIAHAAIAAHLLGLPMGYVRSGNKDHTVKTNIIIQTYHCFGYALDLLVTVSSMCYHTSTSALSTSSSSRGLTTLWYGKSYL